MYVAHPSLQLNELFARKPYQGALPSQAMFLFVGLDANYNQSIEANSIFSKVVEYHADGVAFWKKYQVHHPFMFKDYSGDGRFYHQSFNRIGFGPQHAHLVSFVELLHVPTVGRNVLEVGDLVLDHLKWLNDAILKGNAQHIFIPSGVARLMRETGCFSWLPRDPSESLPDLRTWLKRESKTVYSHLHFSVYGKFEKQKKAELAAISRLLAAVG